MKLGYFEIAEMGQYISDKMRNMNISHSDLIISTTKEDLVKIDEDFYYRNNPKGTDFIPSDKEIKVEFPNLTIQIQASD